MKPLSLLTLSIVILFFFGCSKPENTNNTHTSTVYSDTSTNYLRCQINGNYWHNTPDSMSARWLNQRQTLILTAYLYGNGQEVECMSFYLNQGDTLQSGTYGLDINNHAAYLNLFPQTHDTASYLTDAIHTGSIYISFDVANQRVSGDFNFVGGHTSGTDASTISSGQFAMPYITH